MCLYSSLSSECITLIKPAILLLINWRCPSVPFCFPVSIEFLLLSTGCLTSVCQRILVFPSVGTTQDLRTIPNIHGLPPQPSIWVYPSITHCGIHAISLTRGILASAIERLAIQSHLFSGVCKNSSSFCLDVSYACMCGFVHVCV